MALQGHRSSQRTVHRSLARSRTSGGAWIEPARVVGEGGNRGRDRSSKPGMTNTAGRSGRVGSGRRWRWPRWPGWRRRARAPRGSRTPGPRTWSSSSDVRLVAFDSCDGLLDWFHTEAGGPGRRRTGSDDSLRHGGEQLLAADAATAESGNSSSDASTASTAAPARAADGTSSTTNTQEPGVGEPDLTWTDGHRLVTVVSGSLQVVDLDAGALTATVDLYRRRCRRIPRRRSWSTETTPVVHQLLATALRPMDERRRRPRRRHLVQHQHRAHPRRPRRRPGRRRAASRSTATTSMPAWSTAWCGWSCARRPPISASSTRREQARLDATGPPRPTGRSSAESTLDDWLPVDDRHRRGPGRQQHPAVECSAVDHPAAFGGFGLVTVVGLDLGAGAVDPLPAAAVVAGASTVYASTDRLYVTTTRYPETTVVAVGQPHHDHPRFPDAGPAPTSTPSPCPPTSPPATRPPGRCRASCIDQFALSEHDGDLRVATTTQPGGWWGRPTVMTGGRGRHQPDHPTRGEREPGHRPARERRHADDHRRGHRPRTRPSRSGACASPARRPTS